MAGVKALRQIWCVSCCVWRTERWAGLEPVNGADHGPLSWCKDCGSLAWEQDDSLGTLGQSSDMFGRDSQAAVQRTWRWVVGVRMEIGDGDNWSTLRTKVERVEKSWRVCSDPSCWWIGSGGRWGKRWGQKRLTGFCLSNYKTGLAIPEEVIRLRVKVIHFQ